MTKLKVSILAFAVLTLSSALADTVAVEYRSNAEKPIREDISAEFDYTPKFVDINGAKLQYFDEGEGDPVIFLHGLPVWSYVWRNIMPHLENDARVIALDLPGYGGSERGPVGNPAKSLIDHERYFEMFVEKLKLEDVTLVIHDLGGGVGIVYAGRHPENVRAIAFGETPIGESFTDAPLPDMVFPEKASADTIGFFSAMHNEDMREQLVIEDDLFFVNENMLYGITRQLTPAEIEAYRMPFATPESRYAIADVVAGLTIDGKPREIHEEMGRGLRWLAESDVPKLFFQLDDGNLIPEEMAVQLQEKVSNMDIVRLGKGRHFFQEDHPHKVGRSLREWYLKFAAIEGVKP